MNPPLDFHLKKGSRSLNDKTMPVHPIQCHVSTGEETSFTTKTLTHTGLFRTDTPSVFGSRIGEKGNVSE